MVQKHKEKETNVSNCRKKREGCSLVICVCVCVHCAEHCDPVRSADYSTLLLGVAALAQQ